VHANGEHLVAPLLLQLPWPSQTDADVNTPVVVEHLASSQGVSALYFLQLPLLSHSPVKLHVLGSALGQALLQQVPDTQAPPSH
jgi:hypothetical protein